MAKKQETNKPVLERTYNVPLRESWLKAPKYRRSKKAVTALKEFIAKHMKSDNFKIGKNLNELIWKHGIKNPPHHVNVNMVKYADGLVKVELVGKPVEEVAKKPEAKEEPKKAEEKPAEKKEEKAETKPAEKEDDKKEEKPAEAKKEDKKTQEKPAEKPTPKAESKPAEKKAEEKKPAPKTETKKEEPKAETKPEEKKACSKRRG